jgi:hypothetical protein
MEVLLSAVEGREAVSLLRALTPALQEASTGGTAHPDGSALHARPATRRMDPLPPDWPNR